MKEKSISSTYTLMFKYLWHVFLALFFVAATIFLIRNFQISSFLLITAFGLLIILVIRILKDLREASFNDRQFIIKDLRIKKHVDIHNIKRIYRIYTGIFYRIEYLEEGDMKYVDVWPSTNMIKMASGDLPKNFEELLNLIQN